jgi:glycosyltransferase 2 family protein
LTTGAARSGGGRHRTLIAAALLIALAYVGAALITDAGKLMEALRRLGWLGCAAVLGLSAVNYSLRFFRWKIFLSKLGRDLPLGRHFLYYLGGFAFTISPAKAGEALRSLYLRGHDVTYAESIAALFVERLLDLFTVVMLASLIVLDHPAYRVLVFASSLIVIAVIACVCQPTLPPLIDRFGARRSGRVARLANAFANLLRSSKLLLHPRLMVFGIFIGIIAWGAEALGFGVICQGLHISGTVWSFCGIYAVAVLAGSAAVFLPAGIGGTELVMTTLLVERGTDLRVAIIATLLCRLATLWFAVLLGIGAASAVEISDQKVRLTGIP